MTRPAYNISSARIRSLYKSPLFYKFFIVMGILGGAIFFGLLTWGLVSFRAFELERNRAATKSLTQVIVMAMQHAMLIGRQDMIQQQFYSYRDLPFIKEISLTDHRGIIRRSTNVRLIGESARDRRVQQTLRGDETVGAVTSAPTHGPVFESLVPVLNERECLACHAADIKVLGVLKIQNAWRPVVENFRHIAMAQGLSFFAGLSLVGLIMMGLLWHIVIKPLGLLREAMRGLADGVWGARISLRQQDELGELATAFNGMAEAVEASVQKEKEIAAAASLQRQALEQANKDLEYQISLRGQAEVALTESERSRAALLGNLPGMAYRCREDQSRTMEFVSEGARGLTGYAPEELIASRSIAFGEIIMPEDRGYARDVIQAAVKQGEAYRLQYRFRRRDGQERWAWEQGRPFFDHDGAVLFLDGLILDISDRVDAEAALKRAAQEWRSTFDTLNDGVCLISPGKKIIRANAAMRRITGLSFSALLESTCCEVVKNMALEPVVCLVEKACATKQRESVTVKARGERWLSISADPILSRQQECEGVVYSVADITQLKENEERQRLAQLGKLVAHMAHEVNNPLMIISGRAQLAEMEPIDNETVRQSLEVVIRECQRAKVIIQQLLKVSRPSKQQKSTHDMHQLIDAVVSLLGHQFGLENVIIEKQFTAQAMLVQVDAGQIHEVLINLFNNAREAMPQGGKIVVSTLCQDNWVRVCVGDSGPGMPADVRERVFEQFFTTKASGTGLGLSICNSIIREHQGQMHIEGEPGAGTRVYFSLPLIDPGNAVTG